MTRFRSVDDLPDRYRRQARRQLAHAKPTPPNPHCSEKDWQAWVEDAARMNGWLPYHTRDSRKSAEGFPDLVLLRAETDREAAVVQRLVDASADAFELALAHVRLAPRSARLVAAELKTDKGKLSKAQQLWLATFTLVTPNVYVWRPSQWEFVWKALA